jgi:ketosteroid isomerase-like protein
MTAPSDQQSEDKRVLAAEDEYVAAELARDEAALRRLVDDRFAFNTSRGTITGKEELIQGVLRMGMVGQTIRERSVLIEGGVALVFGTAELRFAGAGKPETVSALRYTSTFVNRQGQWRLLALQMQQRAQ